MGQIIPSFSFECSRGAYQIDAYDALSYTWGNLAKHHELWIGNSRLLIGENLRAALLVLRDAGSTRAIWVDAICINQDDVKERNHQVHIMKRIYSEAASVVVWLGPENKSSRAAMDLIIKRNWPDRHDDSLKRKGLLENKDDSLRGLSEIFQRAWWKRIWIVQEVVAARELVVVCGTDKIPWSFVRKACKEIRQKEFSSEERARFLRISGYRNFTALDNFRARRGTMSLTRYLQCTKDYEASDMRDKLYALIGLASDISPEDMVPDYTKATREVFLDLVRFLVTRRRNLDIISSGRLLRPSLALPQKHKQEFESAASTPSWTPDWRESRSLRPLNSEDMDGTSYQAGGDTAAVVGMDAFPAELSVEGIVVDKVDFFGGAIDSPAQDSFQTVQRWQYIAGQHLAPDSNAGAATPSGFWTTIVAGRNYLAAWGSENSTQQASTALEHGGVFFSAAKYSKQARVTECFFDAVTRAAMGRRFFITVNKRMGLGVPEIQLNDRVVVLKGCSVPLITRAVGDHMVIVGESYVSGIVNGEVMEGLAAGKYKTRMIRLR